MLHGSDTERRALVWNCGADDQLNRRVVEDFLFAARKFRIGESLGECRRKIGFFGIKRHELPTTANRRLHLAVDVAVIHTDDGELDSRRTRRRHAVL